MDRAGKGDLSRYVKRVMREKRLKQREVERNSDGKITDGYVADILCGRAKNPSVEKLAALARGLDVDPYELFAVACDSVEPYSGEERNLDMPDILFFLEIMQEVAENPELLKIIEEAIRMTPEERLVMLRSMESLNEHKRKSHQENHKLPRRKKNA